MLLTVLSVQCICLWMLSGCVLVDGEYCMKGLTRVYNGIHYVHISFPVIAAIYH